MCFLVSGIVLGSFHNAIGDIQFLRFFQLLSSRMLIEGVVIIFIRFQPKFVGNIIKSQHRAALCPLSTSDLTKNQFDNPITT